MMVKSLQIIETFNAVSVIVTDKAAILTENSLMVTHLLWDQQGIYEVPTIVPIARETVLQRVGAEIAHEVRSQAFRDLLLGAVLCNNAEEQTTQEIPNAKTGLRLVGDTDDTALYQLCLDRFHLDVATVRRSHPRLKVSPANPRNKCMVSANHWPVENSDGEVLITMKGAPDAVLARCSSYMTDDSGPSPLNDHMRKYLFHRQDEFGRMNEIETEPVILQC